MAAALVSLSRESFVQFVSFPKLLCPFDVLMLVLFGAASQEDYQLRSVSTQIKTISGTEMDPLFQNTCADRLEARSIAKFKTLNRDFDSDLGRVVE
jgi:hypothetical protein